ncbi:MAG: hypothetical protein ACRDCT_14610, partial [Shewanella sp.]
NINFPDPCRCMYQQTKPATHKNDSHSFCAKRASRKQSNKKLHAELTAHNVFINAKQNKSPAWRLHLHAKLNRLTIGGGHD